MEAYTKGCVGPVPCHYDAAGDFHRCPRLAHSNSESLGKKFVIVQASSRTGWFLYAPPAFVLHRRPQRPSWWNNRFVFTSHADAVEAMNLAVAACG